jgi:hypothetical protein
MGRNSVGIAKKCFLIAVAVAAILALVTSSAAGEDVAGSLTVKNIVGFIGSTNTLDAHIHLSIIPKMSPPND